MMEENKKKKAELTPEILDYIFKDIKNSLSDKKILEERIKAMEQKKPPILYTFACYTIYGEILDEGQVVAHTEEEGVAMVRKTLKLEPDDVVELIEVESSYGVEGVYNMGDY